MNKRKHFFILHFTEKYILKKVLLLFIMRWPNTSRIGHKIKKYENAVKVNYLYFTLLEKCH